MRLSLDDIQEMAKERGGICLSQVYRNNSDRLRWKCSDGHEWEAVVRDVRHGTWCPKCAVIRRSNSRRMGAAFYQKIAKERGGEALFNEYKNCMTRVDWKCSVGHVWSAMPIAVQRGTWCPTCAVSRLADANRGCIEDFQQLATEKGGACLSTTYKNSLQKLKWVCADGHTWEAPGGNIKQGSWCPYCRSSSLGEESCRAALEHYTGLRWPKSRPNWLKQANGRNLELDGLCEELNLAFEYQGEQHYGKFKNLRNTFESLKKRDAFKLEACIKNRTPLLEIPYNLSEKGRISVIKYFLRENHVIFKTEALPKPCTYKKSQLKELQSLAESRGGNLLSKTYLGVNQKHKWVCSKGHEWLAKPCSVKNGSWCLICSGKAPLTLISMQEIAKQRGGSCLSTEYVNCETPLVWGCNNKHTWKATPHKIKRGDWCPYCSGRRLWSEGKTSNQLRIEECQAAAHEKGGVCLNETYTSGKIKMKWRCSEGHVWEMRYSKIKHSKQWCPTCARKLMGRKRRRNEDPSLFM